MNRSASYRHSLPELRPLAGALGAELPGLDLSQDASTELIAALREALLDHLVIFLPGQDLTPEQLVRFGRRFGTLATAHILPSLPGVPEVMPLDSSTGLRTDIWHSDVTYYEAPPMATLLYAREIPEVGGDTMFANMYLAYERLSPPIQRMLDPLTAVHGFTERFVRRINHRDQVIPPEDKPGPTGTRPPLMRASSSGPVTPSGSAIGSGGAERDPRDQAPRNRQTCRSSGGASWKELGVDPDCHDSARGHVLQCNTIRQRKAGAWLDLSFRSRPASI